MARPLRIEFAGAVYHVTSRGNARQDIYHNDQERSTFLEYLSRVCERYQWLCHAYCLMSNHYHLLVETENPTLSKGMKYLNGRYTQTINRSHHRVGHLFQGRFKGILVEKDSYLLELARYIVLNPVRAGMARSAKDWRWSSYRATAGFIDVPHYLVTGWLLAGFGDQKQAAQERYRRFVSEGKQQPSPWSRLKNQIYLGSDQFVERMQHQLKPEQSLDDIPKAQTQGPAKPLVYYRQKYSERDLAMAEAYRDGHYTLKQVGGYFGVSYSTVSRAARKYGV